ncbi:Hypothetical predicted protein [Olea europaea subsp. europaea]|uniref:Uncharacterized protein n=1 Tax=Olea europaea subsp. europaea TaxID=158383 RepID=A0A8S0VMS6_OLEEU|nr:Hypothetical predicted protein [Olea europaea subsp. europaea]
MWRGKGRQDKLIDQTFICTSSYENFSSTLYAVAGDDPSRRQQVTLPAWLNHLDCSFFTKTMYTKNTQNFLPTFYDTGEDSPSRHRHTRPQTTIYMYMPSFFPTIKHIYRTKQATAIDVL